MADLPLMPMFAIGVAVLVLTTVGFKIYELGSSTEFEKQFYATDAGLLIDSLYAIRPDTNVYVDYLLPSSYGLNLRRNNVIVYRNQIKDGQRFWFNEDVDYTFHYKTFAPGRDTGSITLGRHGTTIGAIEPSLTPTPFCEYQHNRRAAIEFDHRAVSSIGAEPVQLATGSDLWIRAQHGTPRIIIYTNTNPRSADYGCALLHALYEAIPDIEAYAIIPVNQQLIHPDDPRALLAPSSRTAVFADIHAPDLTQHKLSTIGQALQQGIQDYAE